MEYTSQHMRYEQFLQDGLASHVYDEQAIAAFSAAIALNTGRAEGFMYRGILWADRGDDRQAERDLREALAISTCPIASYRLSLILSDQEQHAEAQIVLERAIAQYTADGELWYLLGIVLDRMNRPVQAVHALDTAARYGYGHDTDLLALRAKIYNELGEWERSIRDCSEAARHGGCSSELFFQRGLAELQLERWFEATVSFTRALVEDKLNPAIYYARSLAFQALGNSRKAERDMRKAIQLGIDL
jgi:tetratricopeptide (TPR) repeat protein